VLQKGSWEGVPYKLYEGTYRSVALGTRRARSMLAGACSDAWSSSTGSHKRLHCLMPWSMPQPCHISAAAAQLLRRKGCMMQSMLLLAAWRGHALRLSRTIACSTDACTIFMLLMVLTTTCFP
jgi:hypothetical protein